MKKHLLLLLGFIIFSCQSEPEIINYTLSVSVTPDDSGTVSPQTGEYEEGSSVTIRATGNSNFVFDSWSGNASGSENPLTITMDRNKNITANFNVADSDGDGVNNSLDQCDNTPSGATVNAQGCATSQIDTDGDGVFDDVDQDNETRSGVPVDENGVMQNPIFQDENGVTIKARDWAIVGDIGEINGTTYTIVNEEQLRNKINRNEDVTIVCTSKILDMSNLILDKVDFNQNIGNWDTSNVISMTAMFTGASSFNQDIGNWDTSSVVSMFGMFRGAHLFNQNIGIWNVSRVTDMTFMFGSLPNGIESSFNQDIGDWDVSNVVRMRGMFYDATSFNQNIGEWDTSNVIYMGEMFFRANAFNQDIGSWDVANVGTMGSMFSRASAFNQDIGNWDTSNVIIMSSMFSGASSFNQNIGYWDTSNVLNMETMFLNALSFNQDLSSWCVSQLIVDANGNNFSSGSALINSYKPLWGTCNKPNYKIFLENNNNTFWTYYSGGSTTQISIGFFNRPEYIKSIGVNDVTNSISCYRYFFICEIIVDGAVNELSLTLKNTDSINELSFDVIYSDNSGNWGGDCQFSKSNTTYIIENDILTKRDRYYENVDSESFCYEIVNVFTKIQNTSESELFLNCTP